MDVLDTLVAQFTDPLACLRELIQNALDAGSDVVDVHTLQDGDTYILEVQDHGAGMDRATIDGQLTKLFSSSKDGDLTKIGKFGIGFVSVFALDPVAVCVDTAKAGERWRVVFARDRSFTRVTLDEPMEGTRVRLFLDAAGVQKHGGSWPALVDKARATVKHWCRHVEREVLFDGVAINEPLGLPRCCLTVTKDDGQGTVVVAGIGAVVAGTTGEADDEGVEIGFYNKGLTLLEARSWEDVDAGVSVRVSSRWLEHTLTRDSVVRDDRYWKAMRLVKSVVDEQLFPAALARLEASDDSDDSEDATAVRGRLLVWLETRALDRKTKKRPLLRGVDGARFSIADVVADAGGRGCFVAAMNDDTSKVLAPLVAAAGARVVAVTSWRFDEERTALAAVCGLDKQKIGVLVDAWLAVGDVDAALAPRVARLAEMTRGLLDAAGLLKKKKLVLRPVIGERDRTVATFPADLDEQKPAPGARAFRRIPPAPAAAAAAAASKAPCIVVDAGHPEIEALLRLAGRDTALAAFLLAKTLLQAPLDVDADGKLAVAALKLREAEA